jgi:virginiamycin B lyase
MRAKSMGVSAGLIIVLLGWQALRAETVVLSGQVTSADEGPMEGVLVSAKRIGSGITVTVVSDSQGRYGFPAAKLEPGHYALRIRAVGYELGGPPEVDVTAQQPTVADLRLGKAEDLAAQLSNGEWIASMPGTDQQRSGLLNCIGCHTVERIVRSKHDAAEFMETMRRMAGYVQQSMPSHPQLRVADRLLEEVGEEREKIQRRMAEFLSTVNLSAAPHWPYALKTAARPKGRATRVVITEYALPRETVEPHDVIVDADGIAWYSSFGEPFVGRLDPKTGKVTEYPLPRLKPDFPLGSLGLRSDPGGNLWLGMMYQAGVAKFDPRTEKVEVFSLPNEVNIDAAQVNMVSPQRSSVDGKVWMQNNGFAGIHRLDLATGGFETFEPFKDAPKGEAHNIYDVIPDSQNNVYFTDFRQRHIGRIDARTGKITLYATPTANSGPRRGMMDAQDRLWFGEYRGNRIGMFDTRTEKFQEWPAPTPWFAPYDVAVDRNGEAWSGSMSTDLIWRLDPRTGQSTEYLLPRETNVRRVFVDNSTTPVTFWVGSNHGASAVKLEPLD